MAIHVTPDRFEEIVLEGSKSQAVLVDFWAPWCGPCKQLTPVLEELEAENAGRFLLAKANIEDHPELAKAFGIQGIPSLRLFQDGQITTQAQGVSPKSELQAWLSRYIGGEELELIEAARAAEAAADDATAEEKYRAALDKKPGLEEAVIGLAGVLERTGRLADAAELVDLLDGAVAARIRLERSAEGGPGLEQARAAAASGEAAALHALGLAEAVHGSAEAAIEALLESIAKNKAWNDEAARKALLEVFQLASSDPELVDSARRRLAMLLY